MRSEIAQVLTASIDEIARGWVDDLRHSPRTDVHKQLLSSEIIGGIKGMLVNLANAIDSAEVPDGETIPMPIVAAQVGTLHAQSGTPSHLVGLRQRSTKPLQGPLAQARTAAAMLGRVRHKQNYEIQEVLYEYVKLREHIWYALRSCDIVPTSSQSATDRFAYIDRLLDELMLTTVENFYNTSVRDLEKRAIRDPMTQLYNKDYFYQRLNEEMRRSIRYAEPICIAFIDMDMLKKVNDTYGHQAGDEVIKAVAAAIKSRCRQTDIPCRYGGDEFAVILPETTKAQAHIYAERVVQAMQSLSIVLVSGSTTTGHLSDPDDLGTENVTVIQADEVSDKTSLSAPVPTISIGLASFPEDARNPETLLAKADEALYRSKSGGRNMISD